jgi:hypothetical protein
MGKGDLQGSIHGNSFANGPGAPGWLRRNWELQLVFQARTTSYSLVEGEFHG